MKLTKEHEKFINVYVSALHEKNAVVFAGAGMSIPCGYVNWKNLLKPIADDLGLVIEEEYDLSVLAQLYVDDNEGIRSGLDQLLINKYGNVKTKPSVNHQILAHLPIEIYWTTNYDTLIEDALKEAGKTPDVKYKHQHLGINKTKRDAIVYKMHGDIGDVSETVLTKHEYEDYNERREFFSHAFKNDLISKTFLFIGFSFTDPNLDYLISRIRTTWKNNVKGEKYYFIEKERESKKANRQRLKIKSLMRYGLYPIIVDDYNQDIPKILREVEVRYRRSTIFVSGSAAEYDKLFDENRGLTFLHELSNMLSKQSYKIASGFGVGIGSAVINGVLENMQAENMQKMDDFLILRPFPQIQTGNKSIKDLWKDYRKSFIPLAGIVIFVFGNKKDKNTGEIVLADGMQEEFDIAISKGLKVIPVGATGYRAKELWNIVMANFDYYYSDSSLKNLFEKIGNPEVSNNELISNIIHIINRLNKK